ncbi:MAG: DNA2/NAM7 family helicase, partial [Gammaproteobacteria bacterium]|nr:DNA2/NAM7 family helicase [Gammaproteobacteria bacterium]
ETFLAALELHRAFIEHNPEQISRNLALAVDWLQGKRLPAELCQLALDSLTFVVPVISSTFASVARMFADIGKEGIGWLLIDEAGQAMPQQAAGAIWRAQRTIVVGDPLQLEPVVVIPSSIEAALAKHYQIKPYWWPSQTSVQVMADQATPIGTYLPQGNGSDPIWVGAPLRVHRRCDEPMFTISNKVAYGGLMIYGKMIAGNGGLLASGWIDIRGTNAEGHWIAEEGEKVEILIRHLIVDHNVMPKDIFLISPFREVARMLKVIGKKYRLDTDHKVGTVHRAQGKEADIVLLVLGGNPKKHGAKDWAAKKPNLLNVAASRAKQRLYVVGNKLEWGKRRHFEVAARLLPTVNNQHIFRDNDQ